MTFGGATYLFPHSLKTRDWMRAVKVSTTWWQL